VKVYILPAEQSTVGPEVSVDVKIEDAVNLGAYSIDIRWDEAVLSSISITNGSFLGSTGRTVICQPPDVDPDRIRFECSTSGPESGPSGTGVLATIVFATVNPGKSEIEVHDAEITRASGEMQKAETEHGSVTVKEPTATPTLTPTPTSTPSDALVLLFPDQDSRVIESNPDTNFGTNPHLNVDPDVNQRQRSFLSFDVSSIPAGATVEIAQLSLCYATPPLLAAIGRQHDLIAVTSSWAEAGVTWNTQPSVAVSATDTINVPLLGGCVTFNVAGDVQSWIDGASNFGWRVSDGAEEALLSAATSYASRDNASNAVYPILSVQYLTP
jgi:hypothetical protein